MKATQILAALLLLGAGIVIGIVVSNGLPEETANNHSSNTVQIAETDLPLKADLQPPPLPPPTELTHIEYRYSGYRAPENSHITLPRKLWRGGNHYLRIDKLTDPDRQQHQSIISTAPHSWYLNHSNNSARHVIDPGPTFNIIVPAFPAVNSSKLRNLQLGQEVAFFNSLEDVNRTEGELNNLAVMIDTAELDDFVIKLHRSKQTELPVQLSISEGENTMVISYDRYQRGLPYDPALFKLPENIRIQAAE